LNDQGSAGVENAQEDTIVSTSLPASHMPALFHDLKGAYGCGNE